MQGQDKTSNCVGKCRQTVTGRYAAGLLCPNEVGSRFRSGLRLHVLSFFFDFLIHSWVRINLRSKTRLEKRSRQRS